MELSDVHKTLNLLKSGKYNHLIENEERYLGKKLSRLKIGGLKEFLYVKESIQKDLTELSKDYLVSEWISLLMYKPGDYFGIHTDGYSYSSDNYDTILSGGYLLNDDHIGGKFIIEGKHNITEIGELFTFDRFTKHEITPVEKGIRYSLHFAVNTLKTNTTI